jgi:hypothetical protein
MSSSMFKTMLDIWYRLLNSFRNYLSNIKTEKKSSKEFKIHSPYTTIFLANRSAILVHILMLRPL